jgi:hypothetical protein
MRCVGRLLDWRLAAQTWGRVWTVPSAMSDEKPISGATVADLGRDGLLALTALGRSKSAQLTQRGSWFARTLADRALELYKATSI